MDYTAIVSSVKLNQVASSPLTTPSTTMKPEKEKTDLAILDKNY